MQGLGFRISGLGFRMQGPGYRIGFRVWGCLGCFWVEGLAT